MRRPALYLLSLALLALPACGGGGGSLFDGVFVPSADTLRETWPLPVRSLEGSITLDGTSDPDVPLRVGDDEDNRSWRAFTSFEVAPVAGSTLFSARLRLYQGNVVGDPYASMGLVFVERIDMGAFRDVADWGATAGARSIGSSDATVGEIAFDVTALVQEALDLGLARVDMRLRFGVTVNPNEIAEMTHFTSYRNPVVPVTLPPTLVLEWRTVP